MSEKEQTTASTSPASDVETLTILKLDEDIDFPGQSNSSPKNALGPGAYTIFIPSTNAIGTAAEYEQVRAFCGELEALEKIGSVTKLGVTSGVWSITFSLDSHGKPLSNEVIKTAFALLKPKQESAEVLENGFVQDDLPFWKLMDGTKVVRKGNFKKKA